MSERDDLTPRPLTLRDAGGLLALQRAAYVSEAQIYNDPFLPAPTQTLDELRTDLDSPALGLGLDGRLVGTVRWTIHNGTAHIGRLVVAPDLQGRGIGTTLLRSAESASGARRFELFAGHLSEANIRLYAKDGVSTHSSGGAASRRGVGLHAETRHPKLNTGTGLSQCEFRYGRCLRCRCASVLPASNDGGFNGSRRRF